MIIYEPVLPQDLLSFDLANLDAKSENYSFSYYMQYLLSNPTDFYSARSFVSKHHIPTQMIYTNFVLGYVLGREESKEKPCLHLSALSVCPSLRKFKIGTKLMEMFGCNGNSYKSWFIDLFVRKSNKIAISFYKKLGYVAYRSIFDYYCSPIDDAFDMRKSLKIDQNKDCERIGKDIHSNDLN